MVDVFDEFPREFLLFSFLSFLPNLLFEIERIFFFGFIMRCIRNYFVSKFPGFRNSFEYIYILYF